MTKTLRRDTLKYKATTYSAQLLLVLWHLLDQLGQLPHCYLRKTIEQYQSRLRATAIVPPQTYHKVTRRHTASYLDTALPQCVHQQGLCFKLTFFPFVSFLDSANCFNNDATFLWSNVEPVTDVSSVSLSTKQSKSLGRIIFFYTYLDTSAM